MSKQEQFLEELTNLSKKYNIWIDGCGCCDSPYLNSEEPEFQNGDLSWDKESKQYISWSVLND